MPIATGTALAVAGGAAALGGVAGAMGQHSSSSTGINLSGPSALQTQAGNVMGSSLSDLQRGFALGPGDSDISAALNSQRGLAGMYQQYSQTGGMPNQQDIGTAQGFANDIFAAQRMQLQQNFTDQSIAYNRQLAASGRGINDPVYAAKMSQEQTRQQQMLGAQQGAYGSQLALAMPGQRLGYAAQGAQIQDALANQALQNRSTLLGLGSQLQAGERNYQLATSNKWGDQTSGGGLQGALTGALGGATAGMNIAGGISSLGGFGGGGGGIPTSNTNPWSFMTGQSTSPASGGGMYGFGR